MSEEQKIDDQPAPPVDFHNLGWQHYLIGKHMPDRIAHQYPTRDRFSTTEEAQFIAGWTAAKEADDALKAEVKIFGDVLFD